MPSSKPVYGYLDERGGGGSIHDVDASQRLAVVSRGADAECGAGPALGVAAVNAERQRRQGRQEPQQERHRRRQSNDFRVAGLAEKQHDRDIQPLLFAGPLHVCPPSRRQKLYQLLEIAVQGPL